MYSRTSTIQPLFNCNSPQIDVGFLTIFFLFLGYASSFLIDNILRNNFKLVWTSQLRSWSTLPSCSPYTRPCSKQKHSLLQNLECHNSGRLLHPMTVKKRRKQIIFCHHLINRNFRSCRISKTERENHCHILATQVFLFQNKFIFIHSLNSDIYLTI